MNNTPAKQVVILLSKAILIILTLNLISCAGSRPRQEDCRPGMEMGHPGPSNGKHLTGFQAQRCKFNHDTGKWEPIPEATWHVGVQDEHGLRAMKQPDHKDPLSEASTLEDPTYPTLGGKPWEHSGAPGRREPLP